MILQRCLLVTLSLGTSAWLLACSAPAAPAPTAQPQATMPPAAATKATVPSANPTPAADKPLSPPVSVKVGGIGSISEGGIIAGIERGYFAEQGLNVELVLFDASPKMIPAVATNQVQAASGVISAALFNAIARGVNLRVVAPTSRYDPGYSAMHLLVRKDLADSGAIKDYKDLKGKKVALVSRASSSDFLLARAMESVGLKLSDADIVEMPPGDMIAAFANKGIEVGMAPEPTAAMAVDKGAAVLWHQVSDIYPGIQGTVVVFSQQMAENTEVANRWMVAYLKALRDYNDAIKKNKGRDEFIAMLQKNTSVKDRALYDKMTYPSLDPNGKINLASMKEQQAWFGLIGQTQGQVDLDSITDMRFVDYALSRLGPYKE